LRDIEAAQAAGAKPILVKTGKGMRTIEQGIPKGVPVYANLAEAVEALLEES
jgi:D-glycero-D-manno-heptose 1,7-bisphosphate phosphatase